MVATLEEPLSVRDYPLATVISARSLYLAQGLPPKTIAEQLSVPVETVYCWMKIHGWTRAREEAQLASITPETVSKTVRLELESASLRSAALVGKTLGLAETAADAGNIRNVMFAASAAKTLADLASKHSGNDASTTATQVNLSFTLSGLYRPDAVNVTPAGETVVKPQLPPSA